MAVEPEKSINPAVALVTALLWLASAALGLVAIFYLHSLSTLVYAALGGREFWVGSLIGQATAIIGGVICLAVIIVTGEYYLKHVGEKRVWKIIAGVLGIEVLIILMGILTS